MSYLEEHLDWVRARGTVIPSPEEAVFRGEPVPPVDPAMLSSLPSDVAEWFEARLWGRVNTVELLTLDGTLYTPEWGVEYRESLPEDYDEVASLGWLPKSPKTIVGSEHLDVMVETVGDKAGWLYAIHPGDLGYVSGPFAKSIPQYLSAVRKLVEVGVLDLSGTADWMLPDNSTSSPLPPNDTPGPLVGLSRPTFLLNMFWPSEKSKPVSESILDILPDFEIVTRVGCIGDVPI